MNKYPNMNSTSASSAVAEILYLHEEITGHSRTLLDRVIRIGELLTEQKRLVGHGNWLPWVERNLTFSARTANNYMRVFLNRGRLKSENVSDLAESYRLLAESDAEPREDSCAVQEPMTREEAEALTAQARARYEGFLEGVLKLRQFRDSRGYRPEYESFEKFLSTTTSSPEEFSAYESVLDSYLGGDFKTAFHKFLRLSPHGRMLLDRTSPQF